MERLLARLERRFGKYAPHGITYYLVALQAFVFIIELMHPGFSQTLVMDRGLILQGQVWRLITYLFIPPSRSPLWVIFALYWLHLIGTSLESEWGSFKYTVFWLIGMVLTTAVAFGFNIPATNVFLLMSLFLAFATLFPDFEIRVFLIIPVKVKWLAMLDGALLLAMVGMADGLARLVPVAAVGNYLLFFAGTLLDIVRRTAKSGRRTGAAADYRRRAEAPARSRRACALCGVTDADPDVEFRVCTCEKCGGKPTDYCLKHARNH